MGRLTFPYGISDFYKLITEGYLYLDRTDRIRLVEEAGSQLLFLRPRRFGKSLWLSTLENYYDVAKADEFERLFGHLTIGQRPTALHNRYFLLRWDFSVVDPQGEIRHIRRSLYNHINAAIERFAWRYQDLLPHPIERDDDDALRSFQSLLAVIQQTPYRLYLLIDEYDNFANEVLMAGRERYEALLSGEGLLKTLFKAVKSASSGLGLDRVFITGVSPVVLSDVTSGYNIAEDVSLHPRFDDLCGFTEAEIAGVLHQIAALCGFSANRTDEALTMMRTFYNGYRFSLEQEAPVYNPTLALYFFKNWQRDCRYPRQMLDSNLAMDRAKIAYIARLPHGEQVILDALSEERPLRLSALSDRFGVEEMLTAAKGTDFMISLLYYFGVLTLAEPSPFGEMVFRIPNLVVRRLYAEQLREQLLPRFQDEGRRAARRLFQRGEIGPLCRFVERRYFPILANRDYRWANELTVKTAFLTLLFDDVFYVIDSEAALERKYADLALIVRPDMRRYRLLDILIEFKYIALQDLGLSGEQVQNLSAEEIRNLGMVQSRLQEATAQLQTYRHAVEARYGEALRLRTYAVIALGFERLVCSPIG